IHSGALVLGGLRTGDITVDGFTSAISAQVGPVTLNAQSTTAPSAKVLFTNNGSDFKGITAHALTDITVDAPITATPGNVFLQSAGTMAITNHGSVSTAPGSGGTLTINGGFAVNGAITVGAGDITLISAAGNDLTINAQIINVGTINL